ncbi:PDZ domain-containing protein [Veillonella caviae]|uniref:PDZ domain-containing protein n=1 Tax=Veillonella caviae TaxID=248316 RepID=UPI0023F761EA|nr:PDZ domain-containing protein [Veillonella caviae]
MKCIAKLFVLTLMVVFPGFVSAMSSVSIKNATPTQVRDYIISGLSSTHANATIENMNDNNLTLLFTQMHRAGLFGQVMMSTENRVVFTFIPQDDGQTQVTYNEVATAYDPFTGGKLSRPIGTAQTELSILNDIKFNFDGGYRFGYGVGNKKQKGGYPIVVVDQGSPAETVGLKVGQILLKVNGEKVKYDKTLNSHNFHSDINFPKTDILTVTDASGIQKDITITSQFVDPKTHKYTEPK